MKGICSLFRMRASVCAYLLLCVVMPMAVAGCGSQTGDEQSGVGFSIAKEGDSTIVTVMSPWAKGKVIGRYAMTVPYQRIACTSATHIGFLRELGLMDRLVGTCRPDRVYNMTDEERARVMDYGDDMQPNLEAILQSAPDAIVLSTYGEGDAVAAQIEGLGIPVLYCNEWTEHNPLARAEWIRFFGACFGCLDRADSVFHYVRNAYVEMVAKEPSDVSVMSGQSFMGTWYVPTGGTFMGRLFADAGARYYYADDSSTSSLPLTMEQALQAFADADVWLGCSARSLEELAGTDEKHTWFQAYQKGQVYNFNARTLPSGANDFWETGVVHPELILNDLQQILHSAADSDFVPDLYFSQKID